jgi:hypothetical protein
MFRPETQAILSRLAQRGTRLPPGTPTGAGGPCPGSAPQFGFARPGASRIAGCRHRTPHEGGQTRRRPRRRDPTTARSMKVLYTAAPTTPTRPTVKLERHLGCDPEETLAHAAHELRSYASATRGNNDVRLSSRLRHLGRRAMQSTPQTDSTRRLRARPSGRLRVCIPASRHRCAEFDRQSRELSRGSGGSGWLLGLLVLRGPSALHPLALSARPDYSPVRQSTGAFRRQAQYFLGFAGHHSGVRADQ